MYRLLYRLEKGGKHFEKYIEKIFCFLFDFDYSFWRMSAISADGNKSGRN